jgi:hypothetical protein
MHEAWESVSEWTLAVADEATDEKARQFFLKLCRILEACGTKLRKAGLRHPL